MLPPKRLTSSMVRAIDLSERSLYWLSYAIFIKENGLFILSMQSKTNKKPIHGHTIIYPHYED